MKLNLTAMLFLTLLSLFTINYRLAPQHHWPACAENVETAIRWVKAHAREYKVDVGRIALIGESAGGHLVSWVGTRDKEDTRVAAVVPFYAPHDLELQVRHRNMLGESMTALLGLTELNDETLSHLSGRSKLEELGTDGIQVSDAGLAKLTALTSLRSLSFFHPSFGMKGFDGSGFAVLKALPKLERLTIAGTPLPGVAIDWKPLTDEERTKLDAFLKK